jgi:hypothetical protein
MSKAVFVLDEENDNLYGPFDSEDEAEAYMKQLGADGGWGPTEDELKADPDYKAISNGLRLVDPIAPIASIRAKILY